MKLSAITIISILMLTLVYACESDSAIEFKQYYSSGAVVYQQHCQNCHGNKGQGLAALIPPLTDTAYLKANIGKLPCLVQYGLNAPIKVAGKIFTGNMPAAGLTPIEVGQVITYIANSFGNHAGIFTDDNVRSVLVHCGQ